MNKETGRCTARETLRERLQYIALQAAQAKKLDPQDDRLLDLVDDIDRDVQAVIEIINQLRRDGEVNA